MRNLQADTLLVLAILYMIREDTPELLLANEVPPKRLDQLIYMVEVELRMVEALHGSIWVLAKCSSVLVLLRE